MRSQRINCNSGIPVNQCLNCWSKMDAGAAVCPMCGTKYIDFFDPELISQHNIVLRLRDPKTRRGVDVLLNPACVDAYVRNCTPDDNMDLYPVDGYSISNHSRPVSKYFELGFQVDANDDDFIMRFVDG